MANRVRGYNTQIIVNRQLFIVNRQFLFTSSPLLMVAEWMHINEAVRTYNKTRQTFYNRINKGYLQSKKVNNKIYIASQDVERLVSDYIGEPPHTATYTDITHPDESSHEHLYELIGQIEQNKHDLTQKIDEQKLSLLHDINLTKQELRTDIQRAAEGVQQQLHILNEQTTKKATTHVASLTSRVNSLHLQQKKSRFRIGYMLFVLVNAVTVGILYIS